MRGDDFVAVQLLLFSSWYRVIETLALIARKRQLVKTRGFHEKNIGDNLNKVSQEAAG
jgi:hypothetical protein